MREAVARAKQAKLRNPSIFISPLRLCMRNIPLNVDDRTLRRACQKIAGPSARITEVRQWQFIFTSPIPLVVHLQITIAKLASCLGR